MKEDLVGKEKEFSLEAAKSDFMAGLMQKGASITKLKLQQTEDELADFKAWFDLICDNLNRNSTETDSGKKGCKHINSKSAYAKKLEDEVKRLKHECEKLASEKTSKVSALERENAFVWNQYDVLQNNLSKKLEAKQAEIEQSNEKIVKVLARVELLQSSNNEKDEMIGRLTSKVAEMEADRNKWKAENSKLSQELELLRKSKSSQVTPVLRNCSAGTRTFTVRVRSGSRDRSNCVVKKELPHGQAISYLKDDEKDSGKSKRQGVEVITGSEIPRLFSTSFKVPKLKSSSIDTSPGS